MANYSSTWQYEPLRAPSNWNSSEKKFVSQLTSLFDDIYSWRNRLRFEDLNYSTQKRITDTEGNVSELEQTANSLKLSVSNFDKTKLWQAESEASLLQQLEEANIELEEGIMWNDTTNLLLKRYNGSGWDTMQTTSLRTNYIDIDENGVEIQSGGSFKLSAGNSNSYLSITTEGDYFIWAGAESPQDAPFSVLRDGALFATSGTIGGFTVTPSRLYHAENNVELASTGYFKLGAITLQTAGEYPFISGETSLYLRVGANDMLYASEDEVTCPVPFVFKSDVTLENLPNTTQQANLYIDGNGNLFRVTEALAVTMTLNVSSNVATMTANASGGEPPYTYEYFYTKPGGTNTSNGSNNSVTLNKSGTWTFNVIARDSANNYASSEIRSYRVLPTATVTNDASMLSTPGDFSTVILVIPSGTSVQVTGSQVTTDGGQNIWYQVYYNGVYGYVNYQDISL